MVEEDGALYLEMRQSLSSIIDPVLAQSRELFGTRVNLHVCTQM